MHHLYTDQGYVKKAWWQLHKNVASFIERVLEAAFHIAAAVWSPTTNLKNHRN